MSIAKNRISLKGVREHNLKQVDLNVDHNQFVVVSGVSGSGKSTLAFDTIYAEGCRRYVETFSPYTRQFLDRLHQPDIQSMEGARPALALGQRNSTLNSRSTVGTATEINEYLKVLWSHAAKPHCPKCAEPIISYTPSYVRDKLVEILNSKTVDTLLVAAPIKFSGSATIESLTSTLESQGLIRYYCPNTKSIQKLSELKPEKKSKKDAAFELLVVVDRIAIPNPAVDFTTSSKFKERIITACQQAFSFGKGELLAILLNEAKEVDSIPFFQQPRCENCGITVAKAKPSLFSFNSPLGACEKCHGFGRVLEVDINLCVPDSSKSIADGAVVCWNTDSTRVHYKALLNFCSENDISIDKPWAKLSIKEQKSIFEGNGSKKFRGIKGWFAKLQRKIYKMHVRVFLSRYRSQFVCSECNGTRLKAAALNFKLNGLNLPQFWLLSVEHAIAFLQTIDTSSWDETTNTALAEVVGRFSYLNQIGLSYLTLDRQMRTLSGGESQRVNLTSILGSRLVNTTIVLDEPTIGLHPRDTERLVSSITDLRDRGNSLFVVEHDKEVIASADEVIDLGPLSGEKGGEIIYQGDFAGLLKSNDSLTAKYFAADFANTQGSNQAKTKSKSLVITGAKANNLKSIDVRIPLNQLVVLSGVSGSGKSSLIHSCLHEPYQRIKQGLSVSALVKSADATISGFEGLSNFDDVVLIDQSPIGKTPRSNPGTYTKAWELIREALASTASAQQLGLSKSSFSFNVDGGRCPNCKGSGFHRIEMQFLSDVFVECEECGGTRFKEKVLSVTYAGFNVIQLLDLSLEKVVELFQSIGEDEKAKAAVNLLSPLIELGLGYLRLGHPLSQVSGGEAQRIKLASYLSENQSQKCLFILDEPTTGLHPHNIQQLLLALRKLVNAGHSVLCVEHNLDVINVADWMIELGPDGGEKGGYIVAEGNPAQLLSKQRERENLSPTLKALSTNNLKLLPKTVSQQKKISKTKASLHNSIIVNGAKEHNLKNISVRIPHNAFSVITGVSGSGKSTLAFDIIFAEGQRRYIDSLSPYARQFITQLKRAEVDLLDCIPPTIAVSQKTAPPLGLSTIATTTEIYQYLRLLYSKVGMQHCPKHDLPITSLSVEGIAEEIVNKFENERIFLFAPVVSGRKGHYNELFQRSLRAEIDCARIDSEIVTLEPSLRLERHKLHTISLLVASLTATKANSRLLQQAIEQSLLLANGAVEVAVKTRSAKPYIYSTSRVCPKCKQGFRELDPQDFSFSSKRGACAKCGGKGFTGAEDSKNKTVCTDCDGTRIGALGRHVYIDSTSIAELHAMTAPQLLQHLSNLQLPSRLEPIVRPIFKELKSRLELICEVGLDYIALNRESATVSGGEAQRLRLARTLGSPLTGVCYVLDEPTIGLHPQDHALLMKTLFRLRDAGNTVIVVEHDENTIMAADYILDIGPGGGANGGRIVAEGNPAQILNSTSSLTAATLKSRQGHLPLSTTSKDEERSWPKLEIQGAKTNNLKNISVSFPLSKLSVVVGVSGAGKSSLIHGSLVPAVLEEFSRRKKRASKNSWDAVEGLETIQRMVEIDQSPIGKTSSSIPVSYLGIFDDIRRIYANAPEAQANGWNASHFSFNTGKGRCDICKGKGVIVIPMSFLPDAVTVCEECNGLRYNDVTLEILYQNLSLGHLLQKTMAEALGIFANHTKIKRALEYVNALGLGYLTLGQPSHTLSGGEAQRIKIAKELSSGEAHETIYVLDEPTIGLHMSDVDKLLDVLKLLAEKGNTVIVIEHDLDLIRRADWLVELGPGPGDAGGKLLYQGSVAGLIHSKIESPTAKFLRSTAADNKAMLRAV